MTQTNAGKFNARDDWLDIKGNENVDYLDDKSFDEQMKSKPKALVMFYAPWCGHCKNMKPAYAEAATDMKITLSDAHLVAIDATKTPGLTQRFTLQGYPTIKYFESGEYKFDYSGGRSKDDIINFMKNPKEKEVPKTQNVVEDKWSN